MAVVAVTGASAGIARGREGLMAAGREVEELGGKALAARSFRWVLRWPIGGSRFKRLTAVHWAARHRRREVYVGLPAVYTILGNKVAPWLAERYLARTAVDSQQTDEPLQSERSGNLFQPVDGDPGARGRVATAAAAGAAPASRR